MPDQERQDSGSGAKTAALIAAAVLVAAPLAAQFEGYAPKTYKDPAGIPTWCYGETEKLKHDPSYIYTKDQCMELLRQRLANDYAPRILRCIPLFNDPRYRYNFGALVDASYNAGWQAACKSRMADLFRVGRPIAACNSFPGWYVTARNRKTGQRIPLKGLVSRRIAEAKVCKGGA